VIGREGRWEKVSRRQGVKDQRRERGGDMEVEKEKEGRKRTTEGGENEEGTGEAHRKDR
jgi:hypothetical protein